MGDLNCSDQLARPDWHIQAATTSSILSITLSWSICRSGDNPPGYASGDMPASNDRHVADLRTDMQVHQVHWMACPQLQPSHTSKISNRQAI